MTDEELWDIAQSVYEPGSRIAFDPEGQPDVIESNRAVYNAGLTRAAEIARERAQEHAMVIASGATVLNAHLLDVAAAIDAEKEKN